MRRADLEHILRAVRDVAQRPAFLVIGSQSVLGTWTEAELPPEATMSAEVDLAPITELDRSRLAEEVRSVLAQIYPEHRDVGVDPQTISDNLDAIGEFSTFHELVAGREQDYLFVAALIEHGLVRADELVRRAELLPSTAGRAPMAQSWARAQAAQAGGHA